MCDPQPQCDLYEFNINKTKNKINKIKETRKHQFLGKFIALWLREKNWQKGFNEVALVA